MMLFPGSLSAGGLPLAQFAANLSGNLQRIVVDRTGLTGNFDIDLTWTPDQMRSNWGRGRRALPNFRQSIRMDRRSLRRFRSSSGSSWNRRRARWTSS
jgi:uncharacterized protein (TIGR03435 family)